MYQIKPSEVGYSRAAVADSKPKKPLKLGNYYRYYCTQCQRLFMEPTYSHAALHNYNSKQEFIESDIVIKMDERRGAS